MVPNGSLTAVLVQAARVAGWLDHGSRRGPAAQGLQPGNLYRFGPPHGTMLVSFPTKVFGSDTADPSHGDSCSMPGRALVPRTEGGPVGGGGVLRLERRQHVVGACRRPCRQPPVPERPAVASDSTVAVRASTEQKNINTRRQGVRGTQHTQNQEFVRPREPGPVSGCGTVCINAGAPPKRQCSRYLRHPGRLFARGPLSPGRHGYWLAFSGGTPGAVPHSDRHCCFGLFEN